jgi:hypothetical protein
VKRLTANPGTVKVFDVHGTKEILTQGKEAMMRFIAMPLIWLILLILALPANTPLTIASVPDETAESANSLHGAETTRAVQEINSTILAECPSALELPLMLGRPAPCLATFSTCPE